jgi:hypothetical protein
MGIRKTIGICALSPVDKEQWLSFDLADYSTPKSMASKNQTPSLARTPAIYQLDKRLRLSSLRYMEYRWISFLELVYQGIPTPDWIDTSGANRFSICLDIPSSLYLYPVLSGYYPLSTRTSSFHI